ncbi:hypothetical protein GCM10025868_35670 [Angustibacter aerolatus]|uniref:Uncharacterized protein n=1 Tax=Angustibacter aerolatus TaxID=1162965 RepID=A0ABQ6JJ86_9ACTN|nr:hypothetical protein GCM10025868_35670 [Angustibacter aerolatus]
MRSPSGCAVSSLAGPGAGGEQHDVGVEGLLPAVEQVGDDALRAIQPAGAAQYADAVPLEPAGDVVALGAGQRLDPLVDGRQVGAGDLTRLGRAGQPAPRGPWRRRTGS